MASLFLIVFIKITNLCKKNAQTMVKINNSKKPILPNLHQQRKTTKFG